MCNKLVKSPVSRKTGKAERARYYLFNGFLVVFANEIVEEILEDVIATGISLLAMKVLSIAFLVVCTQTIKILLKRIIKTITYKEGNDKMEKIKAVLKWILANKKSLSSTVVNAVGAGAGITASWTVEALPQIMFNSFNIAPILYTVVFAICFILNEFGICGKGFETVSAYIDRKQEEAKQTAQHEVEIAAKKQLKAEQKAEAAEQKAIEMAAKKQLEAEKKAAEEAVFSEKVQALKDEIKAKDGNL